MKNETIKPVYESPKITIIEFVLSDSIAVSGSNPEDVGIW